MNADLIVKEICKSCGENINDNFSIDFPNKNIEFDICNFCGDKMKYLKIDLTHGQCGEDKVKFTRVLRCDSCNFNLCKINNKQICLWCLGCKQLKYNVSFGNYRGKTHAFVLQRDFKYCKHISNLSDYDESILTHLTRLIIRMT